MRPRPGLLHVYLASVFCVASVLYALSLRSGEASVPRPIPVVRAAAPAAASTLPSLAGDWEGMWEDTVYSVSSNMSFTITVGGTDWNGTGSIDLSSLGLGVQNGTATGVQFGDSLAFTFEATNVGNGSGAIVHTEGGGGGDVTAPLNFGPFVFLGNVSGAEIDGRFYFTSPTGGAGRAHLGNTTPIEGRQQSSRRRAPGAHAARSVGRNARGAGEHRLIPGCLRTSAAAKGWD